MMNLQFLGGKSLKQTRRGEIIKKKLAGMLIKLKLYDMYFYIKVGLFTVFFLQIIVLVIFNLTQMRYHMGYDASSFYLKAMEMVKQGSLFISNWSEQTSLYLDSPVPLAVLFYMITGNIFLSYGLANCVIVLAVLFVFNSILNSFRISEISKLVCLNMITCIYITPAFSNANDLSYFSSVLSSANGYGVRILMLFMVIKIIIDLEEHKCSNIYIIITEILLFVSGISSGWYMLVTVILPLIVYYILRMFIYNSYKEIINIKMAVLFISSIVIILGKLIAVHILNFASRDSQMVLVCLNTFWKNFGSIILGLMELVGAFPHHSGQNVLTIEGLIYMMGFIVFVVSIIGFVYAVRYFRTELSDSNRSGKYSMLLCIVIFNIVMFTILYTTYGSEIFEIRYLIPIFLLLIITVGGFIDSLENRLIFKQFGVLLIFFLYLFLNLYYDHLFFISKNNYDVLEVISEKMNQMDVPVVYMYGRNLGIDSRNLRVVDNKRVYKNVYEDSNNTISHWGDYTYYDDVASVQGKNAIITTDKYYNLIPKYIRNKYRLQSKIENYEIYISETSRFDFISGIENDYGLDYVYSPGFLSDNGEFDEKSGSFVCNGQAEDYAIWGPYVDIEAGNYDFVIHYEVLNEESQAAEFVVSSDAGSNILGHTVLDKEEKTALLNIDIEKDSSALEYRVYNYLGTVVKVDYFEIFKN